MAGPKTRDLSKRYTITRDKKHPKTKVATTEDGQRIVPDRRRWKPDVSYKVRDEGSITGEARELYVDRGIDARGMGTRK